MTLVSYLRVSYIREDANDNGHGGVHGWNACWREEAGLVERIAAGSRAHWLRSMTPCRGVFLPPRAEPHHGTPKKSSRRRS
jgi:hypothetical protein